MTPFSAMHRGVTKKSSRFGLFSYLSALEVDGKETFCGGLFQFAVNVADSASVVGECRMVSQTWREVLTGEFNCSDNAV